MLELLARLLFYTSERIRYLGRVGSVGEWHVTYILSMGVEGLPVECYLHTMFTEESWSAKIGVYE